MNFADDLKHFYTDFAVEATLIAPRFAAPVIGQALLDQPGTALIGGEVLATDYSLRYPAATFGDVRRGDLFKISGASYRARQGAQPDGIDGLEHIVPLERV